MKCDKKITFIFLFILVHIVELSVLKVPKVIFYYK